MQGGRPARVALIFDESRPGTTGVYFKRACEALGVAYDHWWVRDARRIPSGYDLYLRIDHGDDYEVRPEAHQHPVIFYALDTHLPHSWKRIRRLASAYDLICCCHRDAAEALRGAVWLPVACDAEFHGPVRADPCWDVAFVGTEGGVPRKFILQSLRERYPRHFIGHAAYTELGAIYGRAQIGFNYAIANDVNMRVFEVLAAGTLLVTNALRGDDLARLGLHDRRHLVLYRDPGELFSLIDYYLAHPDERRAIALAGAEVVRQRHTYVHRLRDLLTQARARLGVAVLDVATEVSTCASS